MTDPDTISADYTLQCPQNHGQAVSRHPDGAARPTSLRVPLSGREGVAKQVSTSSCNQARNAATAG